MAKPVPRISGPCIGDPGNLTSTLSPEPLKTKSPVLIQLWQRSVIKTKLGTENKLPECYNGPCKASTGLDGTQAQSPSYVSITEPFSASSRSSVRSSWVHRR
jgi:hypothetical protein